MNDEEIEDTAVGMLIVVVSRVESNGETSVIREVVPSHTQNKQWIVRLTNDPAVRSIDVYIVKDVDRVGRYRVTSVAEGIAAGDDPK